MIPIKNFITEGANEVVIIRVNDDNYASKDCFIAKNIDAAKKFICKDSDCNMDELEDYKADAVSSDCIVYDFGDGVIYRIHCKPEYV